jgi:zinc transport system substrate-binding protein
MRGESRFRVQVIVTVAVAALILSGGALAFTAVKGPQTDPTKLQVTASFYPLYFFASQIGGNRTEVHQLIPDNAEPHSWQPKPSDVFKVRGSAVFVYNGAGFEPWASTIVSAAASDSLIIVDTSINITEPAGSAGRLDPHFWLDPLSARVQVDNILQGFIRVDAADAALFTANADALKQRLDQLNSEYLSGLANRTKNDIITTHEGFDYMAARYGFNAYGALGISADSEPSAQALTQLAQLVQSLGLHYVYAEPVYSDVVINAIAAQTGAQVLVLDGIHGRTGAHAGMDYFQIMEANLASLEIGLEVH